MQPSHSVLLHRSSTTASFETANAPVLCRAFQRLLSDELLLFGIFQNHPLGLSMQLAAHGFGAFVDEALHLMGRPVEGVGPFSGRRMHRFPAPRLFELVQAKRGLSSD